MASRNWKHPSIIRFDVYFDILNRLGVDRQTDGRTVIPIAMPRFTMLRGQKLLHVYNENAIHSGKPEGLSEITEAVPSSFRCLITALHEMQTRSSDENSVCPSVCHTRDP